MKKMYIYLFILSIIVVSSSQIVQANSFDQRYPFLRVEITPSQVQLFPGEAQQFNVSVWGPWGMERRRVDTLSEYRRWSINWIATGGSITQSGYYKAGWNSGEYYVKVILSNGLSRLEDTTRVEIRRNLIKIEVQPSQVTLSPGEETRFNVMAYDKLSMGMRELNSRHPGFGTYRLTWSATGGFINQNGVYRAGWQPGSYYVTATLTNGLYTISDTARVVIRNGGNNHNYISRIEVSPSLSFMSPGSTVQFRATAYDQYGRQIPFRPEWSATNGSIDAAGRYFSPSGYHRECIITATDPYTNVRGTARVIFLR